MAKLLLRVESSAYPESPELTLVPDTVSELCACFQRCSSVRIVLSVGNSLSGRSEMLDVLVRIGRMPEDVSEDDESRVLFATEGVRGVFVWPRPLRINGSEFLLLKMWGVSSTESDAAQSLLVKRVLACLLPITSTCFITAKNQYLFEFLESFFDAYAPVSSALQFRIDSLLVIAEQQSALQHPKLCAKFRKFQASNPCVRFLYRGLGKMQPIVAQQLCECLVASQTPGIHSKFRSSSAIESIATCMQTLVTAANSKLDFPLFLHKVPDFSSPTFAQDLQQFETEIQALKALSSASALQLACFDSQRLRLSKDTVQALSSVYDFGGPIVVLAVMGPQGLGKSTILNSIVHDVLGSSRGSVFPVGNVGEHTTRGCMVLSQPLALDGVQLMLVDLEGLGGTETHEEELGCLQDNLISAALTLASVPCLIVRNEVSSLEFVEKAVERIALLNKCYQLDSERINLVLHDRDTNASENQHLSEAAQRMNAKYFGDREVLKLFNKPNMSIPGNGVAAKKFLRSLMADSNCVKKNAQAEPVSLERLLGIFRAILSKNPSDLSTVRLRTEEAALKELKRRYEAILRPREGPDPDLGTEFHRAIKAFKVFHQMAIQQGTTTADTWEPIKNQIAAYSLEVQQLQSCYKVVKGLSCKELKKEIGLMLDQIYGESAIVFTFQMRYRELKTKLLHIRDLYPSQRGKMIELLKDFESKVNRKLGRSWALYSIQVGLTVFSLGLGIALRGATGVVAAAARSAALFSDDLIIATCALTAVVSAGNAIFSVAETISVAVEAERFFSLLSFLEPRLNTSIASLLDKCAQTPITAFILVGSHETHANVVMNDFVRTIAPFTLMSFDPFTGSTLQVLSLGYHRAMETERESNLCILLYANMSEVRRDRSIWRAVGALILAMPLACMFVNDPQEYASELIFQGRLSSAEGSASRKLLVFHKSPLQDAVILENTKRLSNVELVKMKDFDQARVRRKVSKIKNELDKSRKIQSDTLKKLFEQIVLQAKCGFK